MPLAMDLKFRHDSYFFPPGQWSLQIPTKKHTISWENVHVNTLVKVS